MGLTNTATLNIAVAANEAPVAVAEADLSEGFAPLEVNFTGENSSDAEGEVTYLWDFGTGITSTEANPTYTFDDAGDYEVTLTVTDEEGESDTAGLTIEVVANQPPVAVASANVTSGNLPLTVDFTGDASSDEEGPVSYQWDFDNGFTSTQPNPTFTFNQEGTYEVSLTVTDAEGAEDTDVVQITVGSVVVIPDDPDFELRVNAGGPALSHEGRDFEADTYFIDGKSYTNSNAEVPALYQTERSSSPQVFDYAVPVPDGTYQVTLHFAEIYWGANGGADQSAGKRVFDVNLEGVLVLDNLNINEEVGPQTPLTKTFEVEVTDGELNMNFSSLSSVGGSNQPKLSAFEIVGEQENEAPVAVASASAGSGTAPLTVNFTGDASSDAEGAVSYVWDFGTGDTSTSANPDYTFTGAGTYEVSLTVTDEEGLTDTAILEIDVEAPVVIPDDPDFELRINAGGPALSHEGRDFEADTYFIDGKSYTNSNAEVPALYQTERSSSPQVFDYAVPVPDGTYQVTLHFAEIYWGANGGADQSAGKRVFDVNLEGVLVLDNLNINEEVGPQTPLTKTFEVEVTDGELNMNFSSLSSVGGSNQPKLSAFEIVGEQENEAPVAVATASASSGVSPLTVNFTGDDSSDAEGAVSYLWDFGTGDTSTAANPVYTFTGAGTYEVSLTVTDEAGMTDTAVLEIEVEEPVVIPDDPLFELRVNAGGPALSHEGRDFVADTYFIEGKAYTNSNAEVPALYQSERSSPSKVFDYAVPVPNGTYQVTLHFAEIYWGATGGGPEGTRNRAFDVTLEGELVLDDLDINAEVGPETLLIETFEVEVTDGELNMNFTSLSSLGGADQPKLSAFEIIGQQNDPDFTLYLNTGSADDVSFEGKTFIGDINLPEYYDSDHTFTNTAASEEPLYQSERGSADGLLPLSLAVSVPNGTYTVSTYHNELFFEGGAGNRVFDILIEGELVKDDLDLFLESENNPVKLTFENIVVSDGELNLDFPVSANRPTLSGLAIEGFSSAGARVKAVSTPMLVASPMEGEGPLLVSFSGDLLGTADPELSYYWNFGDGNVSKEKNPKHTFAEAGDYEVEVGISKFGIPLRN